MYDYSNHNRSDKVQHIEPAPVLIVEGILPFVEPELCALFDYKIYVDTDADERILRRLVRDVKERGRSLDSVINQYLTTVKPMHEAFVEPSKRNADIIVPNGGENTAAVEMLAHHIRNLIEKANMMYRLYDLNALRIRSGHVHRKSYFNFIMHAKGATAQVVQWLLFSYLSG